MGTYSVEKDGDIVRIVLAGRFEVQQFLDLIEEITPDESYISDKRLWDLRGAQFDLSRSQIQLVSERAKAGDDENIGKVALLAADDIQIGLLRMYRQLRSTSTAEVRVFQNEPEALSWLIKD